MARRLFGGLILSCCFAGLLAAEPGQAPVASSAGGSGSAGPIVDALKAGKVSLAVRARWEHADQGNLDASNALTIRSRLGYTTAAIQGWRASIEMEDVTALDRDAYNQAGLNPGGAGRTVIADPETTEVNQLWLGYVVEKTDLKLGRQRVVLDNQRFVGDVGWRQNQQTVDAVTIQDKSWNELALTYGYLWQVNRVFSKRHAQGTWKSDSHLINASFAGAPGGTLAGYVYLLDFDNSASNSCATFGASYAGSSKPSESFKLSYRAEYAAQTDYGSNAQDYRTDYVLGELGVGSDTLTGALGYEVLGTENGVGFKTPLATLHAFNGWADLFLATPAGGLRDTYVKIGATLPAGWSLLAFYHRFEADTGADLGDEVDLQATWKMDKQLTAIAKLARFSSDSGLPDVDKLWVQLEFAF